MSETGGERRSGAARRRRRRRGRGGSGAGRPAHAGTESRGAPPPSQRPGTGSSTRRRQPAPGAASGRARAPRSTQPAARPVVDAQLGAHELADAQTEERRRANLLRLRALILAAAAVPAVVLGVVIGVAAGIVAGVIVAVVVLFASAFLVSAGSLALALRLVGGAPVADGVQPALANQVEGLCATIGVAQPELRLVDDPVANACTLSGRGDRSVLVVTSGLLTRLGLIEMEGVVAHELVHLKRRDTAVSSVALATAGLVAWATGRDDLVHLAVGRGREYGADQAAALAVRYPPGLRDALASMGGRPTGQGSPFTGRRWDATRWIWIDPMVGEAEQAPTGELDATAVRLDALAER